MKNIKQSFVCSECGRVEPKWVGLCSYCGQWNSYKENVSDGSQLKLKALNPEPLINIPVMSESRLKTGLKEFDRVVGGGLIKGSLTLIGGKPGVGKSTLLLSLSDCISRNYNGVVLYVSAEENKEQVADRFNRIGGRSKNLNIVCESDWKAIKQFLEKNPILLLVIDSIQTIKANEDGRIGSIQSISELVHEIQSFIKKKSITTLIVGHITKSGEFGGPKVLEHMVDTVVFVDEGQDCYKNLKALKNRFGPTNEIGFLRMEERGFVDIENFNHFFLESLSQKIQGVSYYPKLSGRRVHILEIQALVKRNPVGIGKRIAYGFELKRLLVLLSIMERCLSICFGDKDVIVNVPELIEDKNNNSDLAVIIAIYSSFLQVPVHNKILFTGRVSLDGLVAKNDKVKFILGHLNKDTIKGLYGNSKDRTSLKEGCFREIGHIKEILKIFE